MHFLESEQDMAGSMQRAANWFESAAGRRLLACEQDLLDRELASCLGRVLLHFGPAITSMQLPAGLCDVVRLGPALPGVVLYCTESAWPVREQAADVVVLQHALEFATCPHALLREAARAVRPGGHLLVSLLQPWTLWGVINRLRDDLPECRQRITPARLADWLSLLGFAVENRQTGCYCPPLSSARAVTALQRLEQGASRLQLPGSGLCLLRARKLMTGLRPLPDSPRMLAPLQIVPLANVGREAGNQPRQDG